MVRLLPALFLRHDRCRSLLRGLYGQSDGTGKGCGRQRRDDTSDGRSAEIATERLRLSVFSHMPHGSDETCHAGLGEIDPIQVWIDAERRLIGLQRSKRRKPRAS
ncbi:MULTISPECIES: hypothetical protein [Bradyrhizobium]|uniref:Uncharacterized protein n=1 Tax=Bradyrhizobium diversitatis TaxID=2755406 RepID=A0ABS0P980_9BRAD|nr:MULTISPECIES: hypothetical protein [Bradyrhizobium]MBH5389845.1 hypothetical protein [Bradyrhizobium diversitatis]UPJ64389.1 hypothetical protein IVB23_31150 [Bradyrhizobium sp. 191]